MSTQAVNPREWAHGVDVNKLHHIQIILIFFAKVLITRLWSDYQDLPKKLEIKPKGFEN